MQAFNSFLGRQYFAEPTAEEIAAAAASKAEAERLKAIEDAKKGLFTQDQVNAMMAADRRKLHGELEKLKGAGDPVALNIKVQELSDALLTKEELAKQQAEEAKTKYETALKTEGEARTAWENRYKGTLFQVEVAKAAAKYDAFDAGQLGTLIKDATKVVEVTDATGKGTGEFVVKTTINSADGKKLDLTLDEAVGKLREDKAYANQFKVKGSPGTGITLNNGGPISGGGGADGQPPTDPTKFLAWFAEQRKTGAIKGN